MAQTEALISIEVVYARPDKQTLIACQVPRHTTLQGAIEQSGILTLFPEIDLHQHKIGVFSKIKALADSVQAGDRIEIYRPLLIDPKEARRFKALKQHKPR
jgi:putative ubiquitin-RnfH superfamily antitoxin RatB of RatAB toxin-antitoxin module